MSKAFKYYYDLMSQPSRALWIIFRMGKTNFEECPVALRRQEQLSPDYKKINRFQKVPCIVDNGFQLSESVAILRYLSGKDLIPENLYPKALQQRARVDEFLEWHHLTLRYGCANYFLHLWLLPMRGLAKVPPPSRIGELQREMETQLQLLEDTWLKDSDFLTGSKLTAADLFGACEIEQTRITKYNVEDKYPNISKWLQRVREETTPFYDEGHKYIYKMAA